MIVVVAAAVVTTATMTMTIAMTTPAIMCGCVHQAELKIYR
jgi:hypothetical protein